MSLGCEGASAESSEAEIETGEATVSFRAEVAPIFSEKCNACHHPDNAVDVDLTQPFDPEVGIVNRPNSWPDSTKPFLVVPGDPEASALVLKIERTDYDTHIEGNPMPLHLPRVTESELADLRQWILDGANDDDFYRERITLIFGDGATLGSKAGKCAYCHYAEAFYGPNLVDPFEAGEGVVNVPANVGGTRVIPGDPDQSVLYQKVASLDLPEGLGAPMPLHPERVTAEEAQLIRTWIREGARDN